VYGPTLSDLEIRSSESGGNAETGEADADEDAEGDDDTDVDLEFVD